MSEKRRKRRKEEKPDLEPVPPIYSYDVEAEPPKKRQETEVTRGMVLHPDEGGDSAPPIKVLTPDNIEVSPMADLPQMARRPPDELPVIRGYNVEVEPPRKRVEPEVAGQEVRDKEKLRGTIRDWTAAYRRPSEKPVIIQGDAEGGALTPGATTPTRGKLQSSDGKRDEILRQILQQLKEEKDAKNPN